jgi:hypothetical protein
MLVNSTHPDYDTAAVEWSRARDALAGEDAVKGGGEKYLPRLDAQTDEEFAVCVKRASFFNASARTSEAYLGLMFRRPLFVKLPDDGAGVGGEVAQFQNDADMLGTSLTAKIEWDKQFAAVAGERDSLNARLAAIQIDQRVITKVTKRGLRPMAIGAERERGRTDWMGRV